jgi:glycosidase
MNIFSKIIAIIITLGHPFGLMSQVVVPNPPFPQDIDSVSIIFDASQGNGGLMNYTGDVYVHTGVITQNSASATDWKYVKSNWGENKPETKLERLSANLYRLSIKPDIRSYYNVPAQEKILQMAFVFRSDVQVGGSYLEGKEAGGLDIYINVYEAGLQLNLQKPLYGYTLAEAGDTLKLRAQSSMADSMAIFVNDVQLLSTTQAQIDTELLVSNLSVYHIKAYAWDSAGSVSDSFSCFVRGPVDIQPLPVNTKAGINITSPSSAILALYAPLKQYAHLLGDFNGWIPDSSAYMKRTPDGNYYWLEINGLVPGKEYIYQYLVDGEIRIGDPYCEKVSDPWNDQYITYPGILPYPKDKTSGIASVFATSEPGYSWQNTNFSPPDKQNLMIYELLVRDFIASHNYKTLIDTLDYLQRLGVNAIELMPVNEFEGNSSWGYNPNFYFAVDKYYGTKNELKAFIDTCHGRGIAVILDVVYNHSFGTSPYVRLYWDEANDRPSPISPFYNMIPKHDYNVGYDFNHESMATRAYISRALKFWLEEYRIDGYRLDLSKGFTQKNTLGNVSAWEQYDATRIQILQNYADTIWSVNPDAYFVLEHFAINQEEMVLSSRGMMLWSALNNPFAESAMGYNTSGKSDFSWVYHGTRGWADPHLIGCMETHDEERIIYKCLQYGNSSSFYDIQSLDVALQRSMLNTAFFMSIPGPKMIWQFGELGYDYSINFNGRTGEKPIRWDYQSDPKRMQLYNLYSNLNRLRALEPGLFQSTDVELNLSTALKRIRLGSPGLNMVAIGNFDVVHQDMTVPFPQEGTWYDYFGTDSLLVGSTSPVLTLEPGEFHLFFDKPRKPDLEVRPVWPITMQMPAGLGHIFPNPSSGELKLYLRNDLELSSDIQVEIYDAAGRLIFADSYNVETRETVDLSGVGIRLGVGVYHVKLINLTIPEQVEMKKFVVFR